MIPIFRPQLPTAASILPYIERIDAARWYSNFGPLHEEFRAKIAQHFGLSSEQVALVSNATVGITLALQAVGLRRPAKQCFCPSWTFVATPHAITSAGFSPFFVDVDAVSWTLDADQIAGQDIFDASGIVVVSPFGAPINMEKWEQFAERSGVPVVCDAAASFDQVGRGEFRIGSIPIIISLHATKPFAVGEGGLVLCTDPDIIERIRQMSNFGFSTTSMAQVAGTNAKLSEYSCAVGLAALEQWEKVRKSLLSVRDYYWKKISDVSGVFPFGMGREYASSYMIIETNRDAHQLSSFLGQRGIETRRWWRSGCHQHPAFSTCNTKPLPQTRRLASHTLGLPFFQGLREDEIDIIVDAVRDFHC